MKDLQEQIKQRIILELEHARLLGSFLLPLAILFVTLMFTDQYLANDSRGRYVVGLLVFIIAFLLILVRNECIRRVRKYIEEL